MKKQTTCKREMGSLRKNQKQTKIKINLSRKIFKCPNNFHHHQTGHGQGKNSECEDSSQNENKGKKVRKNTRMGYPKADGNF